MCLANTPPCLTIDKYNTSQDRIDFRVMLFLSCLRAFCLARSVWSRAFCVTDDNTEATSVSDAYHLGKSRDEGEIT